MTEDQEQPTDVYEPGAEVTQYVDPFQEREDLALEPAESEATDAPVLEDAFTIGPVDLVGEEVAVAPYMPEWLDAYLDGRRIVVSDATAEVWHEYLQAMEDGANMHGIVVGDIFDF